MRAGILASHLGPLASPDILARTARRAEEIGYDTIWAVERLLYPLEPRSPYPGTPDGMLPSLYRQAFDPIEALTWVAAHTRHIRLGTSILNMPYHLPVMLARRLATLDVLSGGRLNVGLGQGWSQDELAAVGAATSQRGARADELIDVLKTLWGPDPVSYDGQFVKVAPSIFRPKPVQQPHPPIYVAGFAPTARARVARLADGWLPSGVPLHALGSMIDDVRRLTSEAGRDPSTLGVVLFVDVALTDTPLGEGRRDFSGCLDEIRIDVERARELGVDELILNPTPSPETDTEDAWARFQELLRGLF